MKDTMDLNIKELENSELEISGEIPTEEFEKYRTRTIKKIGEDLEIPGFRKGHIPENILIEHVREDKILEEAAQMALNEHYPRFLKENKIDAIGSPEITITKIAKGNPLGFKIKTAVMPVIKLPDYKKLAVQAGSKLVEKDLEVTDKEVEDTISQIQKLRQKDREEAPKVDDEFVKSLGDFKDAEDFKKKLKKNIKLEKELKEKDKNRLKIVNKIIEETDLKIPRLLIDLELDKMTHQFKHDISQTGIKFEDYLKNIKKTEEDIRKEWVKDAEKRSKLQLIVYQIAKEENIKPDEKEIEAQVGLIMDTHKEADPERARIYVENMLTNEKVFQFLENQK
ncbi:MAG: Trigger factor [Parcubacteria group bacterium GW2011_GWA2_42_18]|nr:MAG: Trigger factor [Parcubacteria group bacterium GW2011_GWA2_42_18]